MTRRTRVVAIVLLALAAGGWPAGATAAADAPLVAATRAGVARYADVGAATAAGYTLASATGPVEHWVNPADLTADGQALDPRRPAALVYVQTSGRLRLVAAMFMMATPHDAAPWVAGARWHHHTWCAGPGGIGVPLPGGPCPGGTSLQGGPDMLHVWLAGVPVPVFAADMSPALVCRLAAR